MENVKLYHSIGQIEQEFGLAAPLHPLVHVIDMAQANPILIDVPYCFNYYCVFLKDVHCGNIQYGRNYYDYQDGTLIFIAPMQELRIERQTEHSSVRGGWVLAFHPDLLRGTQAGHHFSRYTFFSYSVNEALHISAYERSLVIACFRGIDYELRQYQDNNSRHIIIAQIELFLNYCKRFYERQFSTRLPSDSHVLIRFEQLLDAYFDSPHQPIPTVKYFADKMNLSPNYLSDLLRKNTGKSTLEHIRLRLITTAKNKLAHPNLSVSQIAYSLGFDYPQHFSKMFKHYTGMTPNEFRKQP